MLNIIIPLVAGILLGYFLRDKTRVDFGRVVFAAIMALIFSLGFTIGSNGELLSSLPRVGLNAVVISASAMLFSVFFVKLARKVVKLE